MGGRGGEWREGSGEGEGGKGERAALQKKKKYRDFYIPVNGGR